MPRYEDMDGLEYALPLIESLTQGLLVATPYPARGHRRAMMIRSMSLSRFQMTRNTPTQLTAIHYLPVRVSYGDVHGEGLVVSLRHSNRRMPAHHCQPLGSTTRSVSSAK